MYVCMYVFGDTNLNAEGVMPLFVRSYLVNCKSSAMKSDDVLFLLICDLRTGVGGGMKCKPKGWMVRVRRSWTATLMVL